MNTVLLLLAGVALLQILTLVLIFVHQREDETIEQHVDVEQARALRSIFKVHGLLTSMKWNLDILVDGDCGKTNLCQKEFLHNVFEECAMATDTLSNALTGLRSVLTTQFIHECEASQAAEESAATSGNTTVTA